MSAPIKNFYDFTVTDLADHLDALGKARFRSQQLFKWVYEKRVENFSEMTNLSKSFREELPSLLSFRLPEVVSHLVSEDGTQKFLFDMGQNQTVESVLIPAEGGRLTLCVSSEVGCNLACKFCFTAKQKLIRRLTAGEIVGQFVQVSDSLGEDQRISNIVFMGMGEPLDNCDAVFDAIEILHSPLGYNVSKRKITVSTSGLVDKIPLVARSGVRLAVSLNGADDEVRSRIMPINRKYPLDVLLQACRDYYQETKDRITFEYILIKGITDRKEDAIKLARLSKKVPCKINIIAFNEHPASDFKRPSDAAISAFQNHLMNLGVHVLYRRSKGRDILAACGQLNSTYQNSISPSPAL